MFDLSKVTSTYSGRKGCGCGCRGKYTYTSAEHRPDYKTGDEDLNPKAALRMAAKVERLLSDPNATIERIFVDDEYLAVDMKNDRTYTVYFR